MKSRRRDGVWRGCSAGRGELKKNEGGEDHEETLPKGCGDFSIVQLSDTCVTRLSEVDSNFLPCLTHRSVKRAFVIRFLSSARERHMGLSCAFAAVPTAGRAAANFSLPHRCVIHRCRVLAVEIK